MKKVYINTSITQISESGKRKPNSVLWAIINDGESVLEIDHSLKIKPGERFGIDSTTLFASVFGLILQGTLPPSAAEFVNETEFDLRFITETYVDTSGAKLRTFEKSKSAQLIETTYTVR